MQDVEGFFYFFLKDMSRIGGKKMRASTDDSIRKVAESPMNNL